jgi:hypothetical protein
MNNSSLRSADRATHLKIVAVSLVAGILVVGIGLAARHDLGTDILMTPTGEMQAKGPIIKATKPVTATVGDNLTIR